MIPFTDFVRGVGVGGLFPLLEEGVRTRGEMDELGVPGSVLQEDRFFGPAVLVRKHLDSEFSQIL